MTRAQQAAVYGARAAIVAAIAGAIYWGAGWRGVAAAGATLVGAIALNGLVLAVNPWDAD